MTSINWPRVILGGVVAGVIINASGIALAHLVLGPEYVEQFKAKMAPSSETSMLVQHVGARLWFGVLSVFLYAAFRPRFGPGTRSVILAAMSVFLSAGLVSLLTMNNLGLLIGRSLWITAGWTLAETIVATAVGAWIYRESRS